MTNDEELAAWDRDHFWHAFTQMAEYRSLLIERAEGCWLIDAQGNRYLDGVSSMWCNLFGHGHPRIDAAIREQLDQVAHCTSLGMGNRPAATLAKRLADIAPGDLQHVFYASDGSAGVEVALKMAFQYWRQCESPQPEKTEFIALGQAYHGDTIGSASVGGIERFNGIFGPLLFPATHLPTPDPRRLPRGVAPAAACTHFLAELEQVLQQRHAKVAAVVLEPLVQAAAGMVFHPLGYLRGVRELTRRYNVLLITDEIVTAFGRTGRLFACQHEGVVPDILCLGKSITGGYLPLAAAMTHPAIYAAFLGSAASGRALMHGHTYGGNPLAAAAALATLELLEELQASDTWRRRTDQLAALLHRIEQHPHVVETRQLGRIAAVELSPDPASGEAYPAEWQMGKRVCQEALRRGVWLRPLRDVLVVMPPLSIACDELQLLGDVLLESIDAATRDAAVRGLAESPSG